MDDKRAVEDLLSSCWIRRRKNENKVEYDGCQEKIEPLIIQHTSGSLVTGSVEQTSGPSSQNNKEMEHISELK